MQKIRLENACITTSGGQGVDRRDATVADFVVNPKSTDISSADYNTETFAIQQSTSNLKFQVTIKNSDGTTDTYTTPLLNTINVSINGGTSEL